MPCASLPWQRPRFRPLRTGAGRDARAVPLSAGTGRCQDAHTAGRAPGSAAAPQGRASARAGAATARAPGPAAPTSAAAVTPPPAPCSGYIRAAIPPAPLRSAPHGAAAGATARPRAELSRAEPGRAQRRPRAGPAAPPRPCLPPGAAGPRCAGERQLRTCPDICPAPLSVPPPGLRTAPGAHLCPHQPRHLRIHTAVPEPADAPLHPCVHQLVRPPVRACTYTSLTYSRISPCTCAPTHPFLHQPRHLRTHPLMHQPMHPWMHPPVHSYTHISSHPHQFMHLSTNASICPCTNPLSYPHQFIYTPTLQPSTHMPLHPPTSFCTWTSVITFLKKYKYNCADMFCYL